MSVFTLAFAYRYYRSVQDWGAINETLLDENKWHDEQGLDEEEEEEEEEEYPSYDAYGEYPSYDAYYGYGEYPTYDAYGGYPPSAYEQMSARFKNKKKKSLRITSLNKYK